MGLEGGGAKIYDSITKALQWKWMCKNLVRIVLNQWKTVHTLVQF